MRTVKWLRTVWEASRDSYLAPIVFGLVASLPWMFGCAVCRPVWIAEGQAGSPDVEAVVLLPLNAVVPLPVEFESVAERVEAEIRRYLAEAHGRRVATPSPEECRQLWVRSVEEVEAQPDAPKGFEAAVRVLTMKLRRRYALDALVIPSLIYRPARMNGHKVSWDGVSRTLRVLNPPGSFGSIVVSTSFAGQTQAVSLHVLAFDPEGEKVFESFGGLDLAHDVEIWGRSRSQVQWNYLLRPELHEDRELLREGVALAFDPYLTRSDRAIEGIGQRR